MGMCTKKSCAFVITAVLYGLVYLTVVIDKNSFLENILSPIGSFLAFCYLIETYLTHLGKKKKMQQLWLTLALGCFFWTVSDVFWGIYALFFRLTPGDSVWVTFFYLGTNVTFLFTIILYTAEQVWNWRGIQFFLDAAVSVLIMGYLAWVLFLDRKFEIAGLVSVVGWIMTVTIFVDIVALTGMAIWIISIQRGKMPVFLRVMVFFMTLFYLNDLFWTNQFMEGKYNGPAITDFIYIFAILGIAFGAVIRNFMEEETILVTEMEKKDSGKRVRGIRILVSVAVLLVMVILRRLVGVDILHVAGMLIVYSVLTEIFKNVGTLKNIYPNRAGADHTKDGMGLFCVEEIENEKKNI